LHPDEHEEARKYWSNCLRTGEGGEHKYRVRNAQGDYHWFVTRAEPLRASDGTLLLWIGTTLDIEELKCVEQALRESEYKLRQIIKTVPGLLWSLAPDGGPTHFNQRLLDYFGNPFENLTDGGWGALVHPDDLPEAEKAFSHAIQTGANGVLVAVRDSGPGINPEHVERVFEAFYTTKSSGVGMGLSICRSIIDAHGGRLWADANEPRGAVFRFTGAES
jgi:PAS domain-containing protein